MTTVHNRLQDGLWWDIFDGSQSADLLLALVQMLRAERGVDMNVVLELSVRLKRSISIHANAIPAGLKVSLIEVIEPNVQRHLVRAADFSSRHYHGGVATAASAADLGSFEAFAVPRAAGMRILDIKFATITVAVRLRAIDAGFLISFSNEADVSALR